MADFSKTNKERLVEYFKSGAKPCNDVLGVEVEHFVLFDDGQPMSYEPANGRIGVKDVLAHLSGMFDEKTFGDDGDLLGLSNDTANITLEPAAQLEISIAPMSSIEEITSTYQAFRDFLDPYLAENGAHLVTQGYHPTTKALDMPLIPKTRYRHMDAYFQWKCTQGERMMRASASTQVSVDFENEHDAIRKLRVASVLAPVLAAITDNTTTFEGEPAIYPLARLAIWRNVDSDRAGVIPGIFDDDFDFESYADWVLSIPLIFYPDGRAVRSADGSFVSVNDAFKEAPVSDSDIEHIISLVWPDVRLKKFVEIRPADSLPIDLMGAYSALIKGLFYSDESLTEIERLAFPEGSNKLSEIDIDRSIFSIRQARDNALYLGKRIGEWKEALFNIAENALSQEEKPLLAPLREHAFKQSNR